MSTKTNDSFMFRLIFYDDGKVIALFIMGILIGIVLNSYF